MAEAQVEQQLLNIATHHSRNHRIDPFRATNALPHSSLPSQKHSITLSRHPATPDSNRIASQRNVSRRRPTRNLFRAAHPATARLHFRSHPRSSWPRIRASLVLLMQISQNTRTPTVIFPHRFPILVFHALNTTRHIINFLLLMIIGPALTLARFSSGIYFGLGALWIRLSVDIGGRGRQHPSTVPFWVQQSQAFGGFIKIFSLSHEWVA